MRHAAIYTPLGRARLLMLAITMEEIRVAGQKLGLTFREAYAERRRLYDRSPQFWAEVIQSPDAGRSTS